MSVTINELIHLTLLATDDVAMRAREAERCDEVVGADSHRIAVTAVVHYLAQIGAISLDALNPDHGIPIFLDKDGKAAIEAGFRAARSYMATISAALR